MRYDVSFMQVLIVIYLFTFSHGLCLSTQMALQFLMGQGQFGSIGGGWTASPRAHSMTPSKKKTVSGLYVSYSSLYLKRSWERWKRRRGTCSSSMRSIATTLAPKAPQMSLS